MRGAEGVGKRTLQLGALGGISSGLLTIIAFLLILTLPQGILFADPATILANIEASRTTVVTIVRLAYVAAFLYVPFLVVLFESLGAPRPTAARLGTLLGTVAAGATFVFVYGFGSTSLSLAVTYAAASPQERTAIVFAAQAALGVLSALQVMAIFFFGFALVSFGLAFLSSSSYHKGFGWASVVLGIASVMVLYTPGVPDPVSFIFVAIFAILLGAKLLHLSRASS